MELSLVDDNTLNENQFNVHQKPLSIPFHFCAHSPNKEFLFRDPTFPTFLKSTFDEVFH
jgi:hypothetical protein